MGVLAQKIKERNQNVSPKRVEVPELADEGEAPLVVYMHPLTLQQRSKIMPLAVKNDLGFLVKAVVMSARDANGKPVFDLEDEKYMMRTKDAGWIVRLAGYVNDGLIDGAEELGEL